MITKVMDVDGKEIDDLILPPIFDTPYRPDIIKKVYVNLKSLSYQPQGRYPAAGEMVSAESRNTGLGIARIARARGEGFPRAGQAAGVAGVRHGRVAHPPVSWKIIAKKVNKKEKMLGFCSAIAATANKEIINRRGHRTGEISNFPLVVSNDIEKIIKTSDLKKSLISLGLQDDLSRSQKIKRIPSGKSRMRGRSKRTALSSIVVVSTGSSICKLRHSLPGIEVKSIDELSVLDLAPGANHIRLTVYSKNAIEKLADVKNRILRVGEMVNSL